MIQWLINNLIHKKIFFFFFFIIKIKKSTSQSAVQWSIACDAEHNLLRAEDTQ